MLVGVLVQSRVGGGIRGREVLKVSCLSFYYFIPNASGF